jgi:hypothetical protein
MHHRAPHTSIGGSTSPHPTASVTRARGLSESSLTPPAGTTPSEAAACLILFW